MGAAFTHEAAAVYRNVNAAGTLLDNSTADYNAWAADFFYEQPVDGGAVTLTGQYLKVDFDDAINTNLNPGDRLANLSGTNGQKDGWYVKGAYLLPMKIGKEGRLQPFALYENWKFAYLLGNLNQRIKQTGFGVNYYIKEQRVRVSAEYLDTKFDKSTGLNGSRVDPVTFAPLDKTTGFKTFRLSLQIIL